MWTSFIISVTIIVSLMISWAAVQWIWKQAFADYVSDEDAMAGRTKCSNCNCTTACKNKNISN